MKKVILLALLVASVTIPASAQYIEGTAVTNIGGRIPVDTVLKAARKIARGFKNAVRSTTDCKGTYNYEWYCTQSMQDKATIQVMNPRTQGRTTYQALDYFNRLRQLFCIRKVYSRAEFNFTDYPLTRDSIQVSADNHYLVRVKVNQAFQGFNANDRLVYGDMTIKYIVIDFVKYSSNYFEAKIARVEAESASLMDGVK
jgi:hypothetical protein